MDEIEESIPKVSQAMDKIYTLFDLEDLSPKEGMAALINCITESIFTCGDKEKDRDNLELIIVAMRALFEVKKREYESREP